MFTRYNITTEAETAAALKKADAWLSTQPQQTNVAAVAGTRKNGHISGTEAGSRPSRIQPGSEDRWCRRWDLNPH